MRRILAVFALAFLLARSVVSPAFALIDIGNNQCEYQESCAYRNSNYGGDVADFAQREPNWSCGVSNFSNFEYYGTSTSPNDRTSSIWSRVYTFSWSSYFQHSFGGGCRLCLPSGWQGNVTGSQNDSASSMFTSTYYAC